MLSPAQHASLLERALIDAIPESHAWQRYDAQGEWCVEKASSLADGRKLQIAVRRDGDVEVRIYVGPVGVGRAPYEAHFPVPEGEEPQVLAEVARFVADWYAERLVLVYRRGWLRAGRDFVSASDLTPNRRRRLRWTASWRGTNDWAIPR